MSKAQLTTALRRSFGDTVIKSESAIGKLFDSFDFNRTDEMDWRAFLYMLSMLMQPYLYCNALLRCVSVTDNCICTSFSYSLQLNWMLQVGICNLLLSGEPRLGLH